MGLANRILYPSVRSLAKVIALAGWRLKVLGLEHVPKHGPLIIAPNHRSYADPPLVGVSVPREVHFLAKKELFRFKPFGWFIKNLNAHPLNRTGDVGAFKEAIRILKRGDVLILFPEGRRILSGKFGKPKAGIGMLASATKAPILPVYIHNAAHMKHFRRVYVRFGPIVKPGSYHNYEDIASEVMHRIEQLSHQFNHE